VAVVLFAIRIARGALSTLSLTAGPFAARLPHEAAQSREALRARLPLLAKLFAQVLDPLPQLLAPFVRHLLLGHAVDVLRALIEVVGARPERPHDVFGRLCQIAIEPVEPSARPLGGLVLAVEALELALLVVEQTLLLGIHTAVGLG